MTSETRTSYGIAKPVPTFNHDVFFLDLKIEEVHGRVNLRRAINRRHITTDVLSADEAEHLGTRLIEEARLARAKRAGAA